MKPQAVLAGVIGLVVVLVGGKAMIGHRGGTPAPATAIVSPPGVSPSAAPPLPARAPAEAAPPEPPTTSAFCEGNRVSVEEDRFSGETTMKTPLAAPYGSLAPMLVAVWEKGFAARLMLAGDFKESKYLECHSTYILADGQRVTAGSDSHDGSVRTGSVREIIEVPLDTKTIAQIGAASKIEFKVCNDEFEADFDFLQAAREFACKVRERSRTGKVVQKGFGLAPPPVTTTALPLFTPYGEQARPASTVPMPPRKLRPVAPEPPPVQWHRGAPSPERSAAVAETLRRHQEAQREEWEMRRRSLWDNSP